MMIVRSASPMGGAAERATYASRVSRSVRRTAEHRLQRAVIIDGVFDAAAGGGVILHAVGYSANVPQPEHWCVGV